MIKHILKTVWNERKNFSGILIEQLFVFIILMLCIVSASQSLYNYMRPGLPDTEDVIAFGYMYQHIDDGSKEQLIQEMNAVVGGLKQNTNVIAINESSDMTPYMRPDENYNADSVVIDNKPIKVNIKASEINGADVFKLKLTEGEWMTPQTEGNIPVIITQNLADKVGWQNAVGKTAHTHWGNIVVVGVINGFRNDAFAQSHPTIILPTEVIGRQNSFHREFCARVKPGYKREFSSLFYKEFQRIISISGVEPMIYDMTIAKKTSMLGKVMELTFKIIPTLFLLIFAFIGTFGLFWLYSSKRTSEFALRIALGSTSFQLISMVLIESVVITLIAVIPGIIIACFIYELTLLNIIAICATLVIMILFSIFSAWYPAYRVSKINPGIALRYE